jgi:hypothetical protein
LYIQSEIHHQQIHVLDLFILIVTAIANVLDVYHPLDPPFRTHTHT